MKYNESGRTMVETLAVLAIMGVITVGGVIGFSVAMTKHQSNAIAELIPEASREAQIHNKKLTLDSEDDFTQKLDTQKPNCVSELIALAEGKVKITFQETDECKRINSLLVTSFGECQWKILTETTGCYVLSGKENTTCDNTCSDSDFTPLDES